MIALLVLGAALAAPLVHAPSNHLAMWTDVDAHTSVQTVGRELVLHPDRRASIGSKGADSVRWTPGDEELRRTLVAGGESVELVLDPSGRMTLSGTLGGVENSGAVAGFWSTGPTEYLALLTTGRLVMVRKHEAEGYLPSLHVGGQDLAVLFGALDRWDVVVVPETVGSAPVWSVPKIFLLDRADSARGVVLSPQVFRRELSVYAARVRFDSAEAPWPEGSAPSGGGVTTQVPPVRFEPPKVSTSGGATAYRGWASGGMLFGRARQLDATVRSSVAWADLWARGLMPVVGADVRYSLARSEASLLVHGTGASGAYLRLGAGRWIGAPVGYGGVGVQHLGQKALFDFELSASPAQDWSIATATTWGYRLPADLPVSVVLAGVFEAVVLDVETTGPSAVIYGGRVIVGNP